MPVTPSSKRFSFFNHGRREVERKIYRHEHTNVGNNKTGVHPTLPSRAKTRARNATPLVREEPTPYARATVAELDAAATQQRPLRARVTLMRCLRLMLRYYRQHVALNARGVEPKKHTLIEGPAYDIFNRRESEEGRHARRAGETKGEEHPVKKKSEPNP